MTDRVPYDRLHIQDSELTGLPMTGSIFTTDRVPYDRLHIYYLEGRPGDAAPPMGPDFIGDWGEEDSTFLFFSRPAPERVAALLARCPAARLVDHYEMTYDQWQGGELSAFTVGRLRVRPPWRAPEERADGHADAGHPGGAEGGAGEGSGMGQGMGQGMRQGVGQGVGQGIGQRIGQGIGQGVGQGIGQGIGQGVGQDGLEILLDPGVVFGSGTHPTTRDCLALMDRLMAAESIETALDLGCGTGILAAAAARLGCRRVLAVDLNLLAARTTLANIRRNGLDDRALTICARAEDFAGGEADLLIANIHYEVMAALIEGGCLGGKRWLILSGLLRSQADAVADALARRRVKIHERRIQEGIWTTFLGETMDG